MCTKGDTAHPGFMVWIFLCLRKVFSISPAVEAGVNQLVHNLPESIARTLSNLCEDFPHFKGHKEENSLSSAFEQSWLPYLEKLYVKGGEM